MSQISEKLRKISQIVAKICQKWRKIWREWYKIWLILAKIYQKWSKIPQIVAKISKKWSWINKDSRAGLKCKLGIMHFQATKSDFPANNGTMFQYQQLWHTGFLVRL